MMIADLPRVVDDDVDTIVTAMIAQYEADTGRTVYPAQIERLQINQTAYREALVRAAMNDAARQMLVRFAREPMLDYLGELVGVKRIPAKAAQVRMRVVFTAPLSATLMVPNGVRVISGQGIAFETTAQLVVPATSTSAEFVATALEAGTDANNLMPGQINSLIDDLGVDVASVVNISASSGGADQEENDRLRERIMLAPESYSTAGPELAYRHHALSAHQDIIDVEIVGPSLEMRDGKLVSSNGVPLGCVHIYPLMADGLPSAEILLLVQNACAATKTRPLTDYVEARLPVIYDYAIRAGLVLYRWADAKATLAAAQASLAAWRVGIQANAEQGIEAKPGPDRCLGYDIVPGQIRTALQVRGVYDVILHTPASTRVLAMHEWARCTDVQISIGGLVDG